jgi:hypothetical protein
VYSCSYVGLGDGRIALQSQTGQKCQWYPISQKAVPAWEFMPSFLATQKKVIGGSWFHESSEEKN